MLTTLRLVLIGATASGKGTLSNIIMGAFDNFMHISPGDILRLHVKLKTPLGKEVEAYMIKGILVPDELIVDSIFEALQKARRNNWILDGFPRTVHQAMILHGADTCKSTECLHAGADTCSFTRNHITAVINLNVADNILIQRAQNRWVHLPSGRIYSAGFREPKVRWKDDISGEDLVQRSDDQPEVVMERLKIHRQVTVPLIEFYRNNGVDILNLTKENTIDNWPIVEKFLKDKQSSLK